jgi:hypothetical protein
MVALFGQWKNAMASASSHVPHHVTLPFFIVTTHLFNDEKYGLEVRHIGDVMWFDSFFFFWICESACTSSSFFFCRICVSDVT